MTYLRFITDRCQGFLSKIKTPLQHKTAIISTMVALAVMLNATLIINPEKAKAWSTATNLPTCTINPNAFAWAWKDRTTQLLGINVDTYPGSIIIGKRSLDTNVSTPIEVWFSTSMSIDQTTTGQPERRVTFNGGDGSVNIGNDPNNTTNWQKINSINAPFSTTVNLNDFTCITNYSARDGNPVYSTTYTGTYYSSTGVPNQTGTICDTLDIACKVADIFQGVTNTFASVGQRIVTGFASLFAPDSNILQIKYEELKTTMTTKLGFLVYPYTFVTNMLNSYNDTNNTWCTSTSCTKNFGTFFGSNFTVNFLALKQMSPTIWTYILTTIRVLVVLMLYTNVLKKIRSILKI